MGSQTVLDDESHSQLLSEVEAAEAEHELMRQHEASVAGAFRTREDEAHLRHFARQVSPQAQNRSHAACWPSRSLKCSRKPRSALYLAVGC
jgi:hypothetical protein